MSALTLSAPLLIHPGAILGITTRLFVRRRLTTQHIKEAVADFYSIPLSSMTSSCRERKVARPRQVAMYLTRQLTFKSLPTIGGLFGHRDHSTVIHAIRQVEHLMEIDADFAADVAVLRERLG